MSQMDLFQSSTGFLALMISFSAITISKGNVLFISFFFYITSSVFLTDSEHTVKNFGDFVIIFFFPVEIHTGTPNVIDARGQSMSRGVHNGVAFANFKTHKFSYLNITALGTDYIPNGEECGFACAVIPSCFSYNLAAVHGINGGVLCEIGRAHV